MAELKQKLEEAVKPLIEHYYTGIRRQMDERLPLYAEIGSASEELRTLRSTPNPAQRVANIILSPVLEQLKCQLERTGIPVEKINAVLAQVRGVEDIVKTVPDGAEQRLNLLVDKKQALPFLPVDLIVTQSNGHLSVWTPFKPTDNYTSEKVFTFIDSAYYSLFEAARAVDTYAAPRGENDFMRIMLHGSYSLVDTFREKIKRLPDDSTKHYRLRFNVVSLGDLLRETREEVPPIEEEEETQPIRTEAAPTIVFSAPTSTVMRIGATMSRATRYSLLQIPRRERANFPPWSVPLVLETKLNDGSPVIFDEAYVSGSDTKEETQTPEGRELAGGYILGGVSTNGKSLGDVYRSWGWTNDLKVKGSIVIERVIPWDLEKGIKGMYRATIPPRITESD